MAKKHSQGCCCGTCFVCDPEVENSDQLPIEFAGTWTEAGFPGESCDNCPDYSTTLFTTVYQPDLSTDTTCYFRSTGLCLDLPSANEITNDVVDIIITDASATTLSIQVTVGDLFNGGTYGWRGTTVVNKVDFTCVETVGPISMSNIGSLTYGCTATSPTWTINP